MQRSISQDLVGKLWHVCRYSAEVGPGHFRYFRDIHLPYTCIFFCTYLAMDSLPPPLPLPLFISLPCPSLSPTPLPVFLFHSSLSLSSPLPFPPHLFISLPPPPPLHYLPLPLLLPLPPSIKSAYWPLSASALLPNPNCRYGYLLIWTLICNKWNSIFDDVPVFVTHEHALHWCHMSTMTSHITGNSSVQWLVPANLNNKENINDPPHWPFLWGIHRSPVGFPHKGPIRGNRL